MDRRLVARVFSFRYAPKVALESEELRIRRRDRDSHGQLERVLKEMAQREVINTGVIVSPDVRFYPSRSTASSARSWPPSFATRPSRLPSTVSSKFLSPEIACVSIE
jgi:hypothetical protein